MCSMMVGLRREGNRRATTTKTHPPSGQPRWTPRVPRGVDSTTTPRALVRRARRVVDGAQSLTNVAVAHRDGTSPQAVRKYAYSGEGEQCSD